jgi:cell wall-associated NlpC family hydrolase
MRTGRIIGQVSLSRPFLGLALLSLLLSVPGCAPKSVKLYESAPASSLRGSIADFAITLLGKPYRNGAKGPDSFDCSGFVYYVYGRFNVAVPVSTEGLNRTGYEISRDDIAAGDLAIFTISRDYHVGIMINRLEFVHASKSRGVVIDSIDAPYWRRNFSRFRRIL